MCKILLSKLHLLKRPGTKGGADRLGAFNKQGTLMSNFTILMSCLKHSVHKGHPYEPCQTKILLNSVVHGVELLIGREIIDLWS